MFERLINSAMRRNRKLIEYESAIYWQGYRHGARDAKNLADGKAVITGIPALDHDIRIIQERKRYEN